MKTIDSICNLPAGSFKRFIEEKEKFLIELENNRKERIKKSRKMKNLTPIQLDYLKACVREIQELEQLQTHRYQLMLKTLELEDSDELFDICYNPADINKTV